MVEDRVTDGKRVAQLLASELTGLETGPLGAVDVTDADPAAEPSPAGTVAYRVTAAGAPVGTVVMYPERVVVSLGADELVVESGAAVKQTVDAVRERLRGAVDG
ncbi:MAG: hypothetical protein ACI9HI_002503 [Salinirussus sp.]|jgi:hypothetical protein